MLIVRTTTFDAMPPRRVANNKNVSLPALSLTSSATSVDRYNDNSSARAAVPSRPILRDETLPVVYFHVPSVASSVTGPAQQSIRCDPYVRHTAKPQRPADANKVQADLEQANARIVMLEGYVDQLQTKWAMAHERIGALEEQLHRVQTECVELKIEAADVVQDLWGETVRLEQECKAAIALRNTHTHA